MATQIDIVEASEKLSGLVDRALAGEEIILGRDGKPLVRLMPIQRDERRKRGAWRGWGRSIETDVFLAPMDPEDLDAAEGKFSDDRGISHPR